MLLGIRISILAVCATVVSSFLFSETTIQHSETIHNLDGDLQSSQRKFHVPNHKFSAFELERVKQMMTTSVRGVNAAELALQEYESSELYSVSEHMEGKLETSDFVLSSYDQILFTTLAITCSETHALQSITNAIKIRGLVHGQVSKSTDIARQFYIVQSQMQSLQNLASSVYDGTKIRCETSTAHPSFQQNLNFNIVKETKQLIQNLKVYIQKLNQTFNDCETVEILMTFLSRAKGLLSNDAHSLGVSQLAPKTFNRTIRYRWNETEQTLCGLLSDLMAVKHSAEYRSSENQQISLLDTLEMNLQNSLSALGNSKCRQLSSDSHDHSNPDLYKRLYTKIDDLLFELFSYNHSQFCSV